MDGDLRKSVIWLLTVGLFYPFALCFVYPLLGEWERSLAFSAFIWMIYYGIIIAIILNNRESR